MRDSLQMTTRFMLVDESYWSLVGSKTFTIMVPEKQLKLIDFII